MKDTTKSILTQLAFDIALRIQKDADYGATGEAFGQICMGLGATVAESKELRNLALRALLSQRKTA